MDKGYQAYFKQILKLSYPIIIGQIGIVLMGVADTVMIGQVDAVNLAAAGLANSVFFMTTILGIGTLSAISPLVAKARGAGHTNDVALLFRQSMVAALLLTVLICPVLYLLTINLHWFGQHVKVTALATSYLHILNAGTFFMLLFTGVKQFSDGLSLTKPSAIITILGLLCNILWNWILIHGKFGFPAFGLDGAGYATTLTRVLMAVSLVAYVKYNKLYKGWLHVKEYGHERALLKDIFKIGLPSGLQYFFEVGAFASAAIMCGWFGERQLAAHQIAINMASITYMVATGISAGGSIVVGNALGRKNKTDLIKSGKVALLMSILLMGITAIVFACFNKFLVSLYIDDALVTDMAANLLLIAALFQLSDGIQCVSLGILRGIADTRVPTLVTVVAYWVIGIPVGWALAEYANLELYGIWFGLTIGLTFSAVLLSLRFLREAKAINFVAEEKIHYQQLQQE